jgi:hypothetical protein
VTDDHFFLGAGSRKVKDAQRSNKNDPEDFHGSPGFINFIRPLQSNGETFTAG